MAQLGSTVVQGNLSVTGNISQNGENVITDSKAAAASGASLSLVTTGEKYIWNNKTSNVGTVTSITIKGSSPITISSESAITDSGTRTISHANSGATAGSYGDASAQTPGYEGTFKVPYVTVNATGHVTGISDHTVKIPANVDTKNTAGGDDTSSKIFLVGMTNQTTSNGSARTYTQDTAYVGADGCLYSGSTKVLTSHQDISGKADKVSGATNGAIAALNSSGNLVDTGIILSVPTSGSYAGMVCITYTT